jgi:hypothetical protein
VRLLIRTRSVSGYHVHRHGAITNGAILAAVAGALHRVPMAR